jgi:hypothetical protein
MQDNPGRGFPASHTEPRWHISDEIVLVIEEFLTEEQLLFRHVQSLTSYYLPASEDDMKRLFFDHSTDQSLSPLRGREEIIKPHQSQLRPSSST